MIPFGLIVKLIIGFIILAGVGSFFVWIKIILSQNEALKIENKSITSKNEEMLKDNISFIEFMKNHNAVEEIQKKELDEVKNAEDKQKVINDIANRLRNKYK